MFVMMFESVSVSKVRQKFLSGTILIELVNLVHLGEERLQPAPAQKTFTAMLQQVTEAMVSRNTQSGGFQLIPWCWIYTGCA